MNTCVIIKKLPMSACISHSPKELPIKLRV